MKEHQQKRLHSLLPWGMTILIASPLVVWMFIGRFSRYFADDYITSGVLSKLGFWGAQIYWYNTWTGSYLYTFLISLVELGGVAIVPWLPAAFTLIWAILLFGFQRAIFRLIGLQFESIWLGVLTTAIMLGTVKSLVEYDQVLFWQTGIIAYHTNPFFFLLLMLYFLNRFLILRSDSVQNWEFFLMFLIFFILGGASEIWVLMQLALFTISVLASFIINIKMRQLQKMLIVGWLSSMLALLVTAISPGSKNHSDVLSYLSLEIFFSTLSKSFLILQNYAIQWVKDHTILIIFLTFIGLTVGFNVENSRSKITWKLIAKLGICPIICSFLLIWVAFFTYILAFGYRPPDRVVFVPMFILQLSYSLLFILIGSLLKTNTNVEYHHFVNALSIIGIIVLTAILPIRIALTQIDLLPSFRLYGRLWDLRDENLRQSSVNGVLNVEVRCFRNIPEFEDLRSTIWIIGDFEDANNWKNLGAAEYYGLQSISCKDNK